MKKSLVVVQVRVMAVVLIITHQKLTLKEAIVNHNHNHMKKSLAGVQGPVMVVVLIIPLQNLTHKAAIVSHTKII
jgi:hypothetical protein